MSKIYAPDFFNIYDTDFTTFARDVELQTYVITAFKDGGFFTMRIIGTIETVHDTVLICVPIEDPETEAEYDSRELIDKYGLEFITLTQLLGENGFAISPAHNK